MSDTLDELMFLNLDEAAEILQISKRSLVRMIIQKKEGSALTDQPALQDGFKQAQDSRCR